MVSYALLYFVFLSVSTVLERELKGCCFQMEMVTLPYGADKLLASQLTNWGCFTPQLSYHCNHVVVSVNVRRNFSCWCVKTLSYKQPFLSTWGAVSIVFLFCWVGLWSYWNCLHDSQLLMCLFILCYWCHLCDFPSNVVELGWVHKSFSKKILSCSFGSLSCVSVSVCFIFVW